MVCEKATYDPAVHKAMWHNDNPFVLKMYTRRLKKCRGCGSQFDRPIPPKFMISHEERREFWSSYGKKVTQEKVYYHCSASCISPRHPYFKPSEVTAPPLVAKKRTKEDIHLIKSYGIDLSFVRVRRCTQQRELM